MSWAALGNWRSVILYIWLVDVFQGFRKMLAGVCWHQLHCHCLSFWWHWVWWTTIMLFLISPTTLIIVSMVGGVTGFSDALNGRYEPWMGTTLWKGFICLLPHFSSLLMDRQNHSYYSVVGVVCLWFGSRSTHLWAGLHI